MNSPSITLIICYFGEFPRWFNIFLETCKYNSTLKFIIFTNCKESYSCIPNVTFENLSLDEFSRLASRKLGLSICLLEPYKLCDFNPAFGVIFEDFLTETDFWGHYDLDLVFGDIRNFVTSDILAEYDIITAREEYLLGHFTLYRNEVGINRLYEQSRDYKFVFQCQETFSFDECNCLWWYLLTGYNILNIQSPIESMSHVVKRLDHIGSIKAYFNTVMIEQEVADIQCNLKPFEKNLQWSEGRLVDMQTNQEYLYFHFLKKKASFSVPSWKRVPASFTISRKGFLYVKSDEHVSATTKHRRPDCDP